MYRNVSSSRKSSRNLYTVVKYGALFRGILLYLETFLSFRPFYIMAQFLSPPSPSWL